jgi:hypothetical protein
MEPFSIITSVVGLLDNVTSLSGAIARFRQDYKHADEDLGIAQTHALLLQEEIKGLGARVASLSPAPHAGVNEHHSHDDTAEPAVAKALSVARDLLFEIEVAFPSRSDPHTWRSKLKWAMKDKQAFERLKERLRSAESTLQGIVAMEQL